MTSAQALEYAISHTDRKPITLAPVPKAVIIMPVNTSKDLH